MCRLSSLNMAKSNSLDETVDSAFAASGDECIL